LQIVVNLDVAGGDQLQVVSETRLRLTKRKQVFPSVIAGFGLPGLVLTWKQDMAFGISPRVDEQFCEQKQRLIELYRAAVAHYSTAVNDIDRTRGQLAEAEI
jgi:hypothetical protein